MENKIRSNADTFRQIIKKSLNIELAYDLEGVRWLDEYIDRQRETLTDDEKAKLPNPLGSYLGESIRRTYGGTWTQHPEFGWGVRVNDRITVFPFNKVEKHLANAEGDSILGMFTSIAPLLRNHSSSSSSKSKYIPKRPWWKFW